MFLAFSSGSSPIKSTNSAWTCFMLSDPCISVELWLYKSNENKRPLPPQTLFSFSFYSNHQQSRWPRRTATHKCEVRLCPCGWSFIARLMMIMMMWIQQGGFSPESARARSLQENLENHVFPQNAENGDAIDDDDSDDHEKEPQVSLLVILSRVTRRLWNICLLLQVESGECWWWSFLASLIILPELYFIHRKKHTSSPGTPLLLTPRWPPSQEES